jgi:hypothetical protein
MPNYAVAYVPGLSISAPPSTQTTGSFIIGSMAGGPWNQELPQTGQATTSSYFIASPISGAAYIMAIPATMSAALRPAGQPDTTWPNSMTCPQFFYSLGPGGTPQVSDGAFIETCSYILKNYDVNGVPGGTPANPTGCASVADCTAKFATAQWFHNYFLAI